MKNFGIHLILSFIIFVLISCKPTSSMVDVSSGSWKTTEGNALLDRLNSDKVLFMGGIELIASDNQIFGGLSSLEVSNDGRMLMAVSDYSMRENIQEEHRSHIFWFEMKYMKSGRLRAAELIDISSITDSDGRILQGEMESVAQINGTYYGSLDNGRNRADTLWSLNMRPNKNLELTNPYYLVDFPVEYNREGFEAMTQCKEGELLLIHERLPDKKEKSSRYAWIINPESGASEKKYYRTHLEEIKGACQVGLGLYIILEKTYFRSTGENRFALFLLNDKDLEQDTISGELLIEAGSVNLDNFEGISAFQKDGESYIIICSDNNGDWNLDNQGRTRQKNLLLLFKLNL